MSATPFAFSFDMEGLDRNKLLSEAAERLNILRSHFGEAQKPGDSPLAALVKERSR